MNPLFVEQLLGKKVRMPVPGRIVMVFLSTWKEAEAGAVRPYVTVQEAASGKLINYDAVDLFIDDESSLS